MFDLNSVISDKVALNGATIATSTTTTGVIIDTEGYEVLWNLYCAPRPGLTAPTP